MSEIKGMPRLLAEGIESLVQKRVSEMVNAITAEIVAEKVNELKADLQTEVSTKVNNCLSSGQDMLDVMVTITTKRGGR
jgi:flagellar biosynthesis/type III secretory pathway protein FliH